MRRVGATALFAAGQMLVASLEPTVAAMPAFALFAAGTALIVAR